MHISLRGITPNLSAIFSGESSLRGLRLLMVENTEDGLRRPLILQDDGTAQEGMVLKMQERAKIVQVAAGVSSLIAVKIQMVAVNVEVHLF